MKLPQVVRGGIGGDSPSEERAAIWCPLRAPRIQNSLGSRRATWLRGSIPSGPARRCRDYQCSVLAVPASSGLVGRTPDQEGDWGRYSPRPL